MLAAVAVICCWTTHKEIAFWYLIAVGFADFGHIYASIRGVGLEYTLDVASWNSLFAGNVGVSAFLNVNRWLTVMGAFGKIQLENQKGKKMA